MVNRSDSKVLDFYRGSTVLIVGGTGFLGKVLLEKVLRSLEVKCVFLFIRRKNGLSADDRLRRILEDRLFDKVRCKPELLAKIVPVEVDYARSDYGLCSELVCQLRRDVEVIFYSIANVRFEEPLKVAVGTNVFIIRNMLEWCRSLTRLQAFVYTSTFYANCDKDFIEEKVYESLPFGSYEICMNLMSHLSDQECEKIKPLMLGELPNTYTFSKRLAEAMIEKEFASKLPIGIYRPPIVTPTCREPIVGWTDNSYGIVPMIQASFDGVNPIVYGNKNIGLDAVPVDYCVNAMLTCGFHIAQKCSSNSRSVPVFNHYSVSNKCGYEDLIQYSTGPEKRFWNRWIGNYCWISTTYTVLLYLNLLIAGLKDLMTSRLVGDGKTDSAYYRRSAKRFVAYIKSVSFALVGRWNAEAGNLRQLKQCLSSKERQILFFDLEDIDWPELLKSYAEPVIEQYQKRTKRAILK